MYIDKDAFSTAEKVEFSPTGEAHGGFVQRGLRGQQGTLNTPIPRFAQKVLVKLKLVSRPPMNRTEFKTAKG